MKLGASTVGELEGLFIDAARSTGTVGAQASVIVGGERADFVYGTANAELGTPMTVDTVTQLGSTSKLFNAAIVMSLVDEGKLALDAPVAEYIPGLRFGGEPAPDDITLRRLLSMSAGLDFGPYGGFMGDDAIGRYVLEMLRDVPLTYPPGHGFGYSNASVCTAAHAAERVSGLPWDTLLKTRVFEPAGLIQAANSALDLAYVRVAVGHTTVEDGETPTVFRPWHDVDSQNPSGSGKTVAMSAHDLASFGQVFLNGGTAGTGNRVLSEAAVQAMTTPTTPVLIGAPQWGIGSMWGLGPTMSQWDSNTVAWGHAGSALGGSSLVLWFPEQDTVLSFTVNSPTAIEPFTVRMTGELAEALLGARAPAQLTPPAEPYRVERPERYVGTYARADVRIEIAEVDGRLRYQEFNEALAERYREMEMDGGGVEENAPLADEELVAIDDDRFLVGFPGFANGISVFFFGDDEGRATNINMGLRTSRRVSA